MVADLVPGVRVLTTEAQRHGRTAAHGAQSGHHAVLRNDLLSLDFGLRCPAYSWKKEANSVLRRSGSGVFRHKRRQS